MLLLERDSALAALSGARDRAAQGSGSVVLVTGEAGIGKTVLLERFAEDLVRWTLWSRRLGVISHGDLGEGDIWERQGYRIATPFRTAVDAADNELSLEQLTEVVKKICDLAPYAAPHGLKHEAERMGHRTALRMA